MTHQALHAFGAASAADMAINISQRHLNYHDSGLVGTGGAMTILRALFHNPYSFRITLSHNNLGDDGTAALCAGIVDLRRRGRMVADIKEINLSSNNLSDRGLDSIIQYLLLPSPSPQSLQPTVQELILSNNDISLAGPTSHLLSTALSHPSCSLQSLHLTNNIRISQDPIHLHSFFKHLEPVSLVQLQMNVCNLGPADALTIAQWLADPKRGGRLSHFELNANAFGTDARGTNRLAKVVYAGLNTSLLRLELAANDRSTDADGPVLDVNVGQLSLSPSHPISNGSDATKQQLDANAFLLGDELPYATIKPYLDSALLRNRVLRDATQHTALQLLPRARVLLHVRIRSINTAQIKEQVSGVEAAFDDAVAWVKNIGRKASKPKPNVTVYKEAPDGKTPPMLKLPPEVIIHILRCLSASDGIPLPPPPGQAKSFNPTQPCMPIMASALSEAQFTRILTLARDRSTLLGMTQRYHNAGQQKGRSKKDSRDQGRLSLHDAASFLRVVACTDYERQAT